ncbi:hypothetical protein GCM10010182_06080 [Actinomadura cremea]|nr:hypothetical protein GCM10010182_06080 [Actinomadura cremea]
MAGHHGEAAGGEARRAGEHEHDGQAVRRARPPGGEPRDAGRARLAAVAASLAADAEAAFVGATTGPHNLLVIAVCRDDDALYGYLSDRIGALDGIERVETVPVTSYAKRTAPAL